MIESRFVDLPSGAKLEIQPADFLTSKRLYQAIAKEAEDLKMDPSQEIDANFWKGILMRALSSEKIEAQVWACAPKCLYNGAKLTPGTFEALEARQDYLLAMFEIAVENVSPFTKGLLAKFKDIVPKIGSILASRSETPIKAANS